MDSQAKSSVPLFDVYLRLRPPTAHPLDRFLTVERDCNGGTAQITINPPQDDYRRRAVEKYSFTKIFDEEASQLDVFQGACVDELVRGVMGTSAKHGKDGLLATLGVTGSGKSHTILGSKTQRGLTQMMLDILFRSIGSKIVDPNAVVGELTANDISEAQILTASELLDTIYGDGDSCVTSRAQTPLTVSTKIPQPVSAPVSTFWTSYKSILGLSNASPQRIEKSLGSSIPTIRPVTGIARITRSPAKSSYPVTQEVPPTVIYPSLSKFLSASSTKNVMPRLSSLPQEPTLNNQVLEVDETAEYAIVLSMYEIYNNRICDLLSITTSTAKKTAKDTWKPALLFKNTESSSDTKVVAGLRKVICGSVEEALLVLEAGLTERTVAGTGSNATSSRSHGFFCIEIKKRRSGTMNSWAGSTLTVADLAGIFQLECRIVVVLLIKFSNTGSERARTANTYGTTLVEAGKINQSLMLLGQVMQASTGISGSLTDPSISKLAIRQCKLTELLFSNAFQTNTKSTHIRPQQQKAIMIVTADPRGDYNATSQILKYSALAKETTVPRIPSVTSTILANTISTTEYRANTSASRQPSGSHPSHSTHTNTPSPIPSTNDTILRVTSELNNLRTQLAASEATCLSVMASWSAAEARLATLEAEVREECFNEFEALLTAERTRWAAAWAQEKEHGEEHVDRKVEVLVRGLDASATGTNCGATENDQNGPELHERSRQEDQEMKTLVDKIDELEHENRGLSAKVAGLERERAVMRTPSRKVKVLKSRPWNVDGAENLSP